MEQMTIFDIIEDWKQIPNDAVIKLTHSSHQCMQPIEAWSRPELIESVEPAIMNGRECYVGIREVVYGMDEVTGYVPIMWKEVRHDRAEKIISMR